MQITTNYLRQVIKEELDFVLKENEIQKELDFLIQKLDSALKPFEKYLKLNEGEGFLKIPFTDMSPDNPFEWIALGLAFYKNKEHLLGIVNELLKLVNLKSSKYIDSFLSKEELETIQRYIQATDQELDEKIKEKGWLYQKGKISDLLGVGAAWLSGWFVLVMKFHYLLQFLNKVKNRAAELKQLPPGEIIDTEIMQDTEKELNTEYDKMINSKAPEETAQKVKAAVKENPKGYIEATQKAFEDLGLGAPTKDSEPKKEKYSMGAPTQEKEPSWSF